MAPGAPDLPAQWVDVQDLSPWLVTLAENDTPGVFNASGPATTFTREGMMWALAAMSDKAVKFWWPDEAVLEEFEISPPMMYRSERPAIFVNDASIAAGLHYRSLKDTTTQLLDWWFAQPEERRVSPRRWPDEASVQKAIERLRHG